MMPIPTSLFESGNAAGLVQLAVKAQILAAYLLGNVENLSLVHTKVLYHIINRLYAADCVSLNVEGAQQIGFTQARENR